MVGEGGEQEDDFVPPSTVVERRPSSLRFVERFLPLRERAVGMTSRARRGEWGLDGRRERRRRSELKRTANTFP